jgi:NAD(P)-dependent dehydrogenase (short-subunit alcohol dehydrogenase family)
MHKAVIIGVGLDRGLGAQLCKRFAKEGLQVVAAGRTPASLDAVVADIRIRRRSFVLRRGRDQGGGRSRALLARWTRRGSRDGLRR